MSIRNEFTIEVLPDGKIKVTSPGGFSPEVHKDADEFLAWILDAAGGEVETRSLKQSLGNPQQAQHGHTHGHRH